MANNVNMFSKKIMLKFISPMDIAQIKSMGITKKTKDCLIDEIFSNEIWSTL